MKKILILLLSAILITVSCEEVVLEGGNSNDPENPKEQEDPKDPDDDKKPDKDAINTLKDAVEAVRPDFELGVFYSGVEDNIADQTKHDKIVVEQFHGITIWAGMVSMWHGGDKWRFDEEFMDSRYKYACDNDLIMHIHPLIGPNQYMGWWLQTTYKRYTKGELQRFMRNYITTVLERYPEAQYCDVVNEAIEGLTPSGETKWANDKTPWIDMGWYDDIEGGIPQYMIDAYAIAREVRPDMKLIYNENTNSMANVPKAQACYKAIVAMKNAGAEIDAVGMQMHLRKVNNRIAESYTYYFDIDQFNEMVDMYADIGVEVYITEFDLELGQYPNERDFMIQGQTYADVLVAALSNPNVKGFTTWGLGDKYSWVRDWVKGDNGFPFNCQPLMYDMNLEPKDAYTMSLEAVKEMIK